VIGAELATTGGYKLGSVIRRPYMDRQYEVIGILQPNDGVADHPFSVHSPLKEKYGVNSIMFIPVDGTPELLPPELDGAYFNTIAESMKTMVQLWIGVDATQNMTTVMENTLAYIESLPGVHVIQASPTPPTKATYEYVSEQTSSSLEQMGFIVIAVGALSISGLMLMHVLLGAKVIGIKRALGATRDRLVWENLWRYSLLSLCGFLLSLILIQPLLPLIGNFLGVELQVLPKTLLFAMLGVTALAPLCGLIPTVEASKVSPLDAIRDRLGWGLGKRRLDLRQIIVSLAFAAAVGTMFLVSQIGFSTLAGIDANLRAIGRDMLLVEEPPAGSVSPMPTLSEADDASLCVP
jgi:ABC-type antimicrobial peptide transport system permease subunit